MLVCSGLAPTTGASWLGWRLQPLFFPGAGFLQLFLPFHLGPLVRQPPYPGQLSVLRSLIYAFELACLLELSASIFASRSKSTIPAKASAASLLPGKLSGKFVRSSGPFGELCAVLPWIQGLCRYRCPVQRHRAVRPSYPVFRVFHVEEDTSMHGGHAFHSRVGASLVKCSLKLNRSSRTSPRYFLLFLTRICFSPILTHDCDDCLVLRSPWNQTASVLCSAISKPRLLILPTTEATPVSVSLGARLVSSTRNY